ncbi:MAG: thymidylate synthase [Thiomicrorhabdus sp.]|jgi:thymidylate synthase|nr:thymidylate synthase [Thiomicrorhabdus sp.]
MKSYIELGNKILNEGFMIPNERTGKGCLTIINHDLEYDVANNKLPLLTTRKCAWKSAIAELLGYLKGYDSAQQFRELGTKTWDANTNDNKAWLQNPRRKGVDDGGRMYGVQLRDWTNFEGESFDQLKKVVNNLSKGVDDRGEILTMWNPGEIHMGALRSCMYEHQFSILDGTLYLNSTQRSVDTPLGLSFNSVQVFVFLKLMAQITGLKPGKAYHKLINTHIYEDQIELFKEQMTREPFDLPELTINPHIKSLKDIEEWVTVNDFAVTGYKHHEPIKYPFSV